MPLNHSFFLQTAVSLSKYGTCSRLQVGAVLAKDNRTIATGYNGVATGLEHCYHFDNRQCHKSVHAEVNLLAFSARYGIATDGTTAYCTHACCGGCAGPLINAGIKEFHYIWDYRSDSGILALKEAGITVRQWSEDNGTGTQREAEVQGSCCGGIGSGCRCQE